MRTAGKQPVARKPQSPCYLLKLLKGHRTAGNQHIVDPPLLREPAVTRQDDPPFSECTPHQIRIWNVSLVSGVVPQHPQPAAAESSVLAINPIIYVEVSIGFDRIEDLEDALPDPLRREDFPWDAAFLAGKAFLRYRGSSGEKRSPLPDFFIGAHAAIRGYRLLTRDARRYRTSFPTVELITPDSEGA